MLKLLIFMHINLALYFKAHAICYKNLVIECNFGCLESIMLPPSSVSIPRTDVPLETIIGVEIKKRDAVAKMQCISKYICEKASLCFVA